jgi:hypothetical protein
MKTTGVFITTHQGLGDHIVCSGIYREYASRYKHCVVPVIKKNYKEVSNLLSDAKNIQTISYSPEELFAVKVKGHGEILRRTGYKVINLGIFGVGYFSNKNRRFDETLYNQAELSISSRWDAFKYVRNHTKEEELFQKLGCQGKKYIFVHEDSSRNYVINKSYLPKGFKILRPDLSISNKFSFFDYIKIIENASEIHCIESSFCALIESLEINVPKFAHRYARPEAKSSVSYEFTYRSDWKVLL